VRSTGPVTAVGVITNTVTEARVREAPVTSMEKKLGAAVLVQPWTKLMTNTAVTSIATRAAVTGIATRAAVTGSTK